jgi:polyisoprenoid-binding protein YceI
MDMTAVKTKAAGRPKSEDRTRDATLLKPEWFNVLDFPQAVFETKKIVSTGKNTYEAQGTLKLKGISRPVKLPFTLVISGRTAQMAGEATVPRLDFKVGPAADDTEEISAAPEVKVMVKILATRAN